jgi:protein phosphatase
MTQVSFAVDAAQIHLPIGSHLLHLAWAGVTHQGSVRPTNQDAYRVEAGAFVVCDGMGGHLGGERASRIVAGLVADVWADGRPPSVATTAAVLDQANATLLDESGTDPSVAGMGTTVVCLVVADHGGTPVLAAFNIGDSRLYRKEGRDLRQVSHDHSVVQELLDAGEISPEAALTHRDRHVVTRVVGSDPVPEPDFWLFPTGAGTRYLLCTDGVHGELSDGGLAHALDRVTPSEVVEELAEAVIAAGARDNFTALVIDVVGGMSDDVGDDTTPRSVLTARTNSRVEPTVDTGAEGSDA